MKSRKLRASKLVVMIAFFTLTAGYAVTQRATNAGALSQTSKLKNPLQPTEKNIALGLDHFDAHCASCHGTTGKADIEKGKLVSAADLTSDKIQSKSDSELFLTISKGVPGTAMPAFGKTHSPTEIWQTILFLRKLPTLTAEGRAKLESAIPAGARHKHGTVQEHQHPKTEPKPKPESEAHHEHPVQPPAGKPATTQPQPSEHQHDMSKMGKETGGTGAAQSGHN